jgi:hypothetical protein
MKSFKNFREDVAVAGPTNAVGTGNIAGVGQPPGSRSGEPGVGKKKNLIMMDMMKRKKLEQIKK